MPAIGVERPGGELVSEEAQLTLGEVEQRADRGVGLAVVVPEVALEVALDLRDPPVGQQLPAVEKRLFSSTSTAWYLCDTSGNPSGTPSAPALPEGWPLAPGAAKHAPRSAPPPGGVTSPRPARDRIRQAGDHRGCK